MKLSGIGPALTRKVGPFPLIVYPAAGAGALLLYRWWKGRKAAASSTTTTAPAASSGGTYPDIYGSGSGGYGGGSSYGYLPGSGIAAAPTPSNSNTGTQPASTQAGTQAPPVAYASNPLAGFEISPAGTPYVTPQQFSYQTSQPLSAANIAASGKGGPNDLSGLAALNSGTGPNAAELAYFDSLNAAAAMKKAA